MHQKILEELKNMTLEELMAIPLSGRFNGMFETFEEMGSVTIPEDLNTPAALSCLKKWQEALEAEKNAN